MYINNERQAVLRKDLLIWKIVSCSKFGSFFNHRNLLFISELTIHNCTKSILEQC